MNKLGKINKRGFENTILQNCGFLRPEVSTGPEFGVDVSVIDLPGEMAMVTTSDPLSLIPSLGLKESAWLSVHLMANDIATSGLAPQYAQLVLNLPPSLNDSALDEYWKYVHQFCSDIKVSITGGHTCRIHGQESTIAGGGTMMSVGKKNEILVSKNAKLGDAILLTKQCALVSTALLTLGFPETVKNKLGSDVFNEVSKLFYQTSSLREACIISNLGLNNKGISAMHDVTESGVVGGVLEMALASGKGALLIKDKLPVSLAQQRVCELFSLDYTRIIGAGAMLVSVNKKYVDIVIETLKKENINCVQIGEIVDKSAGYKMLEGNQVLPLNYTDHDPYWDAYFDSLKRGWK